MEFISPIRAINHLRLLARFAGHAPDWARAFTLDHFNLKTRQYTGRK